MLPFDDGPRGQLSFSQLFQVLSDLSVSEYHIPSGLKNLCQEGVVPLQADTGTKGREQVTLQERRKWKADQFLRQLKRVFGSFHNRFDKCFLQEATNCSDSCAQVKQQSFPLPG